MWDPYRDRLPKAQSRYGEVRVVMVIVITAKCQA